MPGQIAGEQAADAGVCPQSGLNDQGQGENASDDRVNPLWQDQKLCAAQQCRSRDEPEARCPHRGSQGVVECAVGLLGKCCEARANKAGDEDNQQTERCRQPGSKYNCQTPIKGCGQKVATPGCSDSARASMLRVVGLRAEELVRW